MKVCVSEAEINDNINNFKMRLRNIGKHVLPPNNTRYSYHSGAGRENFVKNVKIKKYEDLIADDLNFKSVITEETKSVDSDKFGDFVQSRTPKKQDTININNSIYVNNIDDDTSQVDNSTNLFNTLQKIDYDSFSGFSTEQKNEPIVLIDKIIKNPQNEQNSTHIEMDLLDMSSKFVNNEDLLNTFEKQTSSLSISTLDNFKSLTPSKSPKISVSESKHSKNDVFSDLFDSMYTTN
ncbi:hypothetical protein A3Q56_00715 [Intoshia linei]|uniref:Uncharacterized protein n=1 Tax=Intoshia linei TaxID=1819745 RepID=A0A177BB06_9BILA|nr:hypothetical protein A3Q56_00715 [Intoshia linei]